MGTEKKKPDQAKAAKAKRAGGKQKTGELSDQQLDKVAGGNANIASIDFRAKGDENSRK